MEVQRRTAVCKHCAFAVQENKKNNNKMKIGAIWLIVSILFNLQKKNRKKTAITF